MAGHSKWANIKHRKEKQDKKRGKIWTKCAKAIMVAARSGGGDPASNLSLRYAIDEARYANMPKDTIQRAIDKGAGAGGGESFEQITYEGYGPGGAAVIIDALTDNRTRTVNDVRLLFKKYGGSMGNAGSVSYMFQTRGQIVLDSAVPGGLSESRVIEAAVEAGADDVRAPEGEGGAWVVFTEATAFIAVKDALERAGLPIAEAEIAKIAGTTASVGGDHAEDFLALIEALEDNDDVQKVYHNAEIGG
jgi:YebC/PmpR family DNA-binding regulatory protein